MFPEDTLRIATDLIHLLVAQNLTLTTAESCTGGLIAACLTEIPGASASFDRGFITYSNAAKTAVLGVDSRLIEAKGAVSEEVARAMAEGALKASGSALSISVTGIAGPGGGSDAKPVGLVHIASAARTGACLHEKYLFGDIGRTEIRLNTVARALGLVRRVIESG